MVRPRWTASEIARALRLPRSTTYRVLGVLVEHGFLERAADEHAYRLGYRVLSLAGMLTREDRLREVAFPLMRELRDATGESVNLNVAVGNHRVCIEKVDSVHDIREVSYIGLTTPLHAGASGKVLLAHFPSEHREAYLRNAELVQLTPNTIVDRERLRDELDAIRARGYGTSQGERILGAVSISAPVYGLTGQVVAALTVSGPAFRFTPDAVQQALPRLLQAARHMSLRLGYLPARTPAGWDIEPAQEPAARPSAVGARA